jgi:hypothetical protein
MEPAEPAGPIMEQAEPTTVEQRQPVAELAADAWLLSRRLPLAVSVVEVEAVAELCRMWELDKASISRRPLTSMWVAAVTSPTCVPAGI